MAKFLVSRFERAVQRMPFKKVFVYHVSRSSLISISHSKSYKLTNRKHLKTGVTQTCLIGVSHTACGGLSHTDFQATSVYKMTKNSWGKLLALIPLSAGLGATLLCEQEPARTPTP